jgi:hypothetical protein
MPAARLDVAARVGLEEGRFIVGGELVAHLVVLEKGVAPPLPGRQRDRRPPLLHPAAPEYAPFLDAHLRWWRTLWTVQNTRGLACTTATPEAGADGYLHTHPFTREPVADLREINRWMAQRLRLEFSSLFYKS